VVELALGIGITLNLILTEVIGLGSAGLVVPGYLALYFNQPSRLLATWLVAGATAAVVRFGIGRLVVLYGRRRFGVTVLTGFLMNALLAASVRFLPPEPLDLRAIGFIVPGLIANQMLIQGFWSTLGLTFLVAALTRLLLVLVTGWLG